MYMRMLQPTPSASWGQPDEGGVKGRYPMGELLMHRGRGGVNRRNRRVIRACSCLGNALQLPDSYSDMTFRVGMSTVTHPFTLPHLHPHPHPPVDSGTSRTSARPATATASAWTCSGGQDGSGRRGQVSARRSCGLVGSVNGSEGSSCIGSHAVG